LVHRTTGVVNVAHGAMAMTGVYAFVALRPAVGSLLSLLGGMAAAAGVAVASHLIVFRPLAGRSPISSVVASVGVLTTIQAVATLAAGTSARFVPSLLPNGPVALAGTTVPADRLILAALVGVASLGLGALLRFTSFGLASRAAAEDTTMVALLGYSPTRLATRTWAVAGALGGAGAIAAGSITGVDPASSSLLVVPALVAAVVAGMASFSLAAVAGLGIGISQSLLLLAQSRWPWLPETGLREALPLVVLVVALALGRGRRLERGSRREIALAAAAAPRRIGLLAGGAIGAGVLALMVLDDRSRLALTTSLIGIVTCLSLVVLTGFAGQTSLAQMTFAGLGGFVLTGLGTRLGVPFPLAPLLAASATTAFGVLVSLPALKVRGTSLALVTLASAVALEGLVFRNPTLTGGFGGAEVPDLGLGPPTSLAFGLFVLAVAAAAGVGVARLRASGFGHTALAVRNDEVAAAACGVRVGGIRIATFALSAFVAGVGGSLIAYSQSRLSFGSFGIAASLSLLAVAHLGGITRVSGAVVGGLFIGGGLVFDTLDRAIGLGRYQLLVTGLILTAVVVAKPDGLASWRPRVARR